ncbi:hypothetical protein HDU76_008995, partial [Blyttiomyces sp. JEL0837]
MFPTLPEKKGLSLATHHHDHTNNASTHSHDHSATSGHAHDEPPSSTSNNDKQEAIAEEQQAFRKVIRAFRNYKSHSLSTISKKRRDYESLPKQQRDLLKATGFLDKLDKIERYILKNWEFLRRVVDSNGIYMEGAAEVVEDDDEGGDDDDEDVVMKEVDGLLQSAGKSTSNGKKAPIKKDVITSSDMDKVRTVLRQFVRDWAKEGAAERLATYQPILDALESIYKDVSVEERGLLSVLVPGAGLGRLAFEIARA